MAINEILAAKQVNIYYGIAQGAIITITSGSGATATVEYTVASPANIQNNSATWTAWPRGTVAPTKSIADLTNTVVAMRVTATGGTVTVDINDNPSYSAIEALEQDFNNSENRIFYHNVGGGQPSTLTNPTYQATASVDNYTQIAIQNKSATANASADQICYPDNVTSSDLTGFVDMGITSSAFSQAAYAVTVANEGYLFMSAPSGAGKTGNLVIATDSTGSANAIKFATGGFNSTANFRAQIDGSGLSVTKAGAGLNVKEGSNCKQGTATLVAGTVVVSNTSVTANSRIFLTTQSVGGTAGFLVVSARTAGTSFTILSSSGTDTSVVAYQIFEPSV